MTVRNPTPHDRYTKAQEIDTSFFEPFDIQHVKERYPNAPEYLATRIGKAISRRRQYFKYRKLHGAKLAQNLEPEDTTTALSETTASNYEEKPSTTLILQRSETASISGMTETSYATSTGSLSGNTAQMPSMPKAATNGQFFECRYCYMIDSVEDTRAWRKHVYRDLEPYMCTFDGCMIGNETYSNRQRWFEHELQMHRSSWTCGEHCQRSFLSGDEFIKHLQQVYPGEVTREQAPGLLKMYAKKVAKGSQISCPLCSCSVIGLTRFRKHLSHHLEGLALFALPRDAGDDKIDEDPACTSDSSEANEQSQIAESETFRLQEQALFDLAASVDIISGLTKKPQESPSSPGSPSTAVLPPSSVAKYLYSSKHDIDTVTCDECDTTFQGRAPQSILRRHKLEQHSKDTDLHSVHASGSTDDEDEEPFQDWHDEEGSYMAQNHRNPHPTSPISVDDLLDQGTDSQGPIFPTESSAQQSIEAIAPPMSCNQSSPGKSSSEGGN